MLTELRIENFAIIDRLELRFRPGFITFTGETGAGKSIIIDAVESLLGSRTDASMIRSGADRAAIEATFHIPNKSQEIVSNILNREQLSDDPEFFTVSREIRSEGRSVARINGRSVNLTLLKKIGEAMIDVHGQSEHLSLLRVREHINLLDRYAGSEELLKAYSQTYRELIAVRKELKELQLAESEAARRIDLLNYQINEIESSRLKPGEEEDLRAERIRLSNAENLASLAQQVIQALDEGTPESPAVMDGLGQIVDALNNLVRIDASQAELAEIAQGAFNGLADLAGDLRRYFEGIEFNPKRLDQIEERLNLIINLKRKYGDSIPAILEFVAKARQEREKISGAGERIAELQIQEESLLAELGKRGLALSKQRRKASQNLEEGMESELAELNMSGAQFRVDFRQQIDPHGVPVEGERTLRYDATGLEQVEFLIAPNPGEGLKPLVKIASGGETSRLMLALKNVLARADHIPTLIFDEIDQGIGGRVGAIVGQKLWNLARHHQVLCVTHLPQLAAFGEQHLQVTKHIESGRTITQVTDLTGEARLEELAVMLGDSSKVTLQSAREMMQTAQQMTKQAALQGGN